MKIRTNICIDEDLKTQSKNFCEQRGLNFSELIEELLKEHLKNKGVLTKSLSLKENKIVRLSKKLDDYKNVLFEMKRLVKSLKM